MLLGYSGWKYTDGVVELRDSFGTDEGSIARVVYNLHPFYTCECGEWYEEDRGFSPEDVFATVERTIYDLYGHSSVALVENVIRIIRGLKEPFGFENESDDFA
jgi:hypothetical protein